MANILTPFGLTPEHFARIDQMKTDPSSFGFKNQFDYARASGKDLVDRSMPGFGIPSMIGQVLATPFYDTYSGIQESKKPYKDDFTQYSGITDYGEMPVGPSLSEVAKGIKDERIGTMMGGRFLGGIDALRERNPGVTGTDYFGDVNISQPPGTNVGIASKLASLGKTISDAVVGPLNAYEFDPADIQSKIDAARNREALNKAGLMSLDDAGLITEPYETFTEVAKPGLNKQFAKQLGYSALGLITGNPIIGLIARGLGALAGRGRLTGIRGGVDLRGDTGFDTFRRSTSLADFLQRRRDKKAREAAARRGAVKELQSRIDRGDFGGNGGGGFSGEGGYGSSAERGGALHG